MSEMEDLTGRIFGRWTVLSFDHKRKKASLWKCRCECGTEKVVYRSALVTKGHSRSCGCLRDELAGDRSATHRQSGTPIHIAWKNIRARCENESSTSYKYYGARGIKVCDRWQVFENFLSDMGPTWSEGMSIEREDNDKDYEPSNCLWIPKGDQSKNRRTNVIIDTPWGQMTCAEASRKIGISPSSFFRRMQGWSPDRWFVAGKPDKRRR